MDTRQLITGLLLALGIFFVYQFIINKVYPPRQPPPAATQPAPPETVYSPQPQSQASPESLPAATTPSTEPALRGEFIFTAGPSREAITIGNHGEPNSALELTLTPRGAGVESIRLTTRKNGHYRYSVEADRRQPYEIVEPMVGRTDSYVSFATDKIVIREYDNRSWSLHDLVWTVAESSEQHVVFTTALLSADSGEELLELSKTYRLQPGQPLVNLGLEVRNVFDRPLTISVVQDGAVGIHRESPMYEMRRLIAAQFDGQTVTTAKAVQRQNLRSKTGEATPVQLFVPVDNSFSWTALSNRFFAVCIRPLVEEGVPPGFVQYVDGTAARPESEEKLGDLVARMTTAELSLTPGEQVRYAFEIYAGPKDPEVLEQVNPDFVDNTKVYYTLAQAADRRCCTFEPLPQIMTGLLHWIQYVVRNYGIAIIILVIIVRTLLHPLTVYQQKQMFRMQDSMARLKPKLDMIKERHPNDRTRQNQEQMKLYAEEGVNPMGTMVGMLPLFIQMPILVALWTGLNTDINLRHAPFDGWWINDLAAPDALISFAEPITIPVLGWLPLLGWMFQGIPSINILPLLMGISMWLQQKYMPKPGMHAKLDAAKKNPTAERKPGQMTPEDQIRQQQMMAYMMSIMFPLMFYYMPSGLNLYWMATNVFGIGESLIIRKQLREEKERREQQGVQAPAKKSGFMARALKKMAAQAEELQKKADTLSDLDKDKPRQDRDSGRKKR